MYTNQRLCRAQTELPGLEFSKNTLSLSFRSDFKVRFLLSNNIAQIVDLSKNLHLSIFQNSHPAYVASLLSLNVTMPL